MGDDGETFPSSEFNKPSLEGGSEQQQLATEGGELNDAEQCEFVPKSSDSDASPFDLKERGVLGQAGDEVKPGQGGVEGTGDRHGANDVEDKKREEAVVGGGLVLAEKVGEENPNFTAADEEGVNEKIHDEALTVQAGPMVVAAEEVGAVDFKEGATSGGDRENGDSDMGGIIERSHDATGDEAQTVVEGEKPMTESDNLQSTAADGLGVVEEEAETVVTPVESPLLMTRAEKEVESSEDKETNVEEMLAAEDTETDVEENLAAEVQVDAQVTVEESNTENVDVLPGLESTSLPKEEMNQMGEKEDMVSETEMDGINRTDELENLRSNDLQYDGPESDIVVDGEANKEWLPGEIPAADSVLEERKEAVTEAGKVVNIECIREPGDADFGQQPDEDEEMLAVADMGVKLETDEIEERKLFGIAKASEAKFVEGADVEFIRRTDDAKLIPQDEKKKIVADEEPALMVSEMKNETGAVEEPMAVVVEQVEEAETAKDAKPALDEEDREMATEEGLALVGMEMETQTDTGEEQILILEREKEAETETAEVANVEHTPETDDTKHIPQDEGDEEMAAEEDSALADTEMETETDAGESSRVVGEKNKRGRNIKVLTNSKIFSKARKTVGEDVCFICFDGGDLVLCDRRGCPKAYHPSCVNRDEAFFRSKGRWNCGWHICNICKKAAHYTCYTCPTSSCKGCIKDAVILCVRGNKGFCETCMRTVMLIENGSEGSNDDQIDFDDKSSWEFLFKDYYTELKSKLSLTSAEIEKAKNPWKGSEVATSKVESPETPVENKDGGASGNDAKDLEAAKPKRKRVTKRSRSLPEEEDSAVTGISSPSNEEWASKELLEFVMHMKNGDKSVLSQFDVQALLLEYIKRNKLRDPRRKSQIICDSRLENLFGKPRVGHFEMLKLLESHFLVKEDVHTDEVQGSVVDTEVNQVEADENDDTLTKGSKEKKRKIRKKSERGPVSNRYDYAAIDTHNINLIYLRRKLMEDILEEGGDFQNKVTGTFVRIRISGNTQKQDLYRLVQVVGTSTATEPYKIGKRTTDVMLEILNLNKTEVVSIDTISNQDFTEEECKRLRQSIKCGLLNRMTVGDILDKAMELQTARVNDWLESETLRLSHLRDRASDMGRRKELRECVEKLQILKTPEERLRRLEEIPKIHADPKMDPNNESEEDDSDTDDNRQEGLLRTTGSGFARRGRAPISPGSDFSPKESWNGGNILSKNWEATKNVFGKSLPISAEDVAQSSDVVNNSASWNQGREKVENKANLSSYSRSENVGLSSNSVTRSESLSGVTLLSSSVTPQTKEAENVIKINETQKMWHYKDPSGKAQGPFSMTQLRKWSNTGYFPNDLRIWKAGEKQDESIVLTDAMAGRFQKKESSGDTKVSTAVTPDAAHGLSGHYVKISETPLQLSREETYGDRPNIDQNHGLQMLQMGVLKGSGAPPVEVPKPSTEKWTRTDLSNLPSPTPVRSSAFELGEQGRNISGTSYPEGKQSPASALSHHGSVAAVNTSVLISKEQLMNGRENDSVSAISSVHALQATSLTQAGEVRAVEDRGHHRAQDNTNAIQLTSQNSHVETHGWGGPPTQKVESNPLTPVPGQQQAYNQWGVVTPPAQNPAVNFSNSGSSALPQPEFWGPMAQSNQPSMQTPAMPTVAWGTGHPENNNSAPTLRPENPNAGWATMQGNPNMGWVAPGQGPTNMNWAPTVQGPPPGNGNSGWVMTTGDTGSSMQGQMPSNVNPGWVAPPVPSGPQGLPMGGANTGWVAPAAANMGPGPGPGPAVQVPGPGTGWGPMASGNQGPPPPMAGPPPSGNTNQGWGAPAPPGNQAGWAPDKYQSGGNFSGQRDNGSQVGDSGYGNGRPWNRQSSFGRRGVDLRNVPRDVLCPYNTHGRCRKGNRCNYIHS